MALKSESVSETEVLHLEFVTVRLMTNIAVAPSSLLRSMIMLCEAFRDPIQTERVNSLLSRKFFERIDQAIVRKRGQDNPTNRRMKIEKSASAIQLCATNVVAGLLKCSQNIEHALWYPFSQKLYARYKEQPIVKRASAQWLHDLAEKLHCAQTGSFQIPKNITTGLMMLHATPKEPMPKTELVERSQKKGTKCSGIMRKKEIHNCAVCGIESKMKCNRCRSAFYCSREHQKEAWASHKSMCKQVAALRENAQSLVPIPKKFKFMAQDFCIRLYSTEEEISMGELCGIEGDLDQAKTQNKQRIDRRTKFVDARWRSIGADRRFDNAVQLITNSKRVFWKEGDDFSSYMRLIGGSLIIPREKGATMCPGTGTVFPRRGGGGPHDTQVVPYHEEQQEQDFADTIPGDCIFFLTLVNEMNALFPDDHVLGINKFNKQKWRKWKINLGGTSNPSEMGAW